MDANKVRWFVHMKYKESTCVTVPCDNLFLATLFHIVHHIAIFSEGNLRASDGDASFRSVLGVVVQLPQLEVVSANGCRDYCALEQCQGSDGGIHASEGV